MILLPMGPQELLTIHKDVKLGTFLKTLAGAKIISAPVHTLKSGCKSIVGLISIHSQSP
jgi:hypothetical protein